MSSAFGTNILLISLVFLDFVRLFEDFAIFKLQCLSTAPLIVSKSIVRNILEFVQKERSEYLRLVTKGQYFFSYETLNWTLLYSSSFYRRARVELRDEKNETKRNRNEPELNRATPVKLTEINGLAQ